MAETFFKIEGRVMCTSKWKRKKDESDEAGDEKSSSLSYNVFSTRIKTYSKSR